MDHDFKKGQLVYFGRPNGEKTLGRVLRVNDRSLSIEQLEERGVTRLRAPGAKWRVACSLCAPAPADAAAGAPAPSSSPPVPAAPPRAEDVILTDIVHVYHSLSPEYLFADGERSRSAAARLASHLRGRLRTLFRELGRKVTEDEAYAFADARREAARAPAGAP